MYCTSLSPEKAYLATATDLHVQSANNIQGFLKGLTLLAGYSTVDTKYNTCNATHIYLIV